MNTERPTPRTDDALKVAWDGSDLVDFARQLERELAEAREELARAEAKIEEDRSARDVLIRRGVELERELDRRHKEYAAALNRRVDVENTLAQIAAGKRDMLTREECRELAVKLGVPPKPLPRPDKPGWFPGPANGGGGTAGPRTEKYPSGQWWDGDELLVVVDVRNNKTGEEWREYRAVRILCDEESFHVEQMDDGDDIEWGPESWSWYMPIPKLPATPPPAPEKGVEG